MYFPLLLIEVASGVGSRGDSPGHTWRGLRSAGRSLRTAPAGLSSPDPICPVHPPTWPSGGPTVQVSLSPVVTGCLWGIPLLRTCFCGAVCRQERMPCGAAEPQHCPAVSPCCVFTVSRGPSACPGGEVRGQHRPWEVKFCGLMNTFFIRLVQDHCKKRPSAQ